MFYISGLKAFISYAFISLPSPLSLCVILSRLALSILITAGSSRCSGLTARTYPGLKAGTSENVHSSHASSQQGKQGPFNEVNAFRG